MKTIKDKIDRLGRDTVLKAMLRVQKEIKKDLGLSPASNGAIEPVTLDTQETTKKIKEEIQDEEV